MDKGRNTKLAICSALTALAAGALLASGVVASLAAVTTPILLAACLGLGAALGCGLSAACTRQRSRDARDEEISALRERLEKISRNLVHLNIFGETLADSPDVEVLLARMLPAVVRTFGAEWGLLLLVDADGRLREFSGPGCVPPQAAAALRHAMAAEQPVCFPHPQGEPSPLPAHLLVGGLGSLLGVPLVSAGGVSGALGVGMRESNEFSQRDEIVLSTIAAQIAMAVENAAAYSKLEMSYLATVSALACAMEASDEYTADHSETIAGMAVEVGAQLGCSEVDLGQLRFAALLHDIGKLGVPEAVLHKVAALTDAEAAAIARHTVIGEHIVSQASYLQPVPALVRAAHERWDGLGYPDGLAGEQIPLLSRIVFVCDAFHAMTSDRPYRRALSRSEALEELRAQAGRQFDPAVVEAFIRVLPAVSHHAKSAATVGTVAS
jgi:GAF domain-containing protein